MYEIISRHELWTSYIRLHMLYTICIYIYIHKRSARQGWGCERKGRPSSAVLNMQSQYDLQRKHKMNLVEAFWIATSTKHCYLQCLMHAAAQNADIYSVL